MGIFPTKQPSSASSDPCSPTSTTNGKSPTAATSPNDPWPPPTRTWMMNPSPPSPAATKAPRNPPQSPPPRGTLSPRCPSVGSSVSGPVAAARHSNLTRLGVGVGGPGHRRVLLLVRHARSLLAGSDHRCDRPAGRSRTQSGATAGGPHQRVSVAQPEELRPASAGRSEIRILFVFDPWRSAILLIGGDKSGNWKPWYAAAIPEAERLYADYLEERRREEEQ